MFVLNVDVVQHIYYWYFSVVLLVLIYKILRSLCAMNESF